MSPAGLALRVMILGTLGLTTFAQAQDQNSNPLDSGRISNDPLRGLIVNRTITVIGWDFYKSFSEIWQALYPDSTDTLSVVERPTAQFGSEIWITYQNQNVFHTFLSPARSRAQDESKKAVEIVHNNLLNIEIQQKYLQDADLGKEEM